MKYLLSCVFSVLFFCNTINAQITTNCTPPYDNATALVNLLVDGVPFSNATLTGFDCAAGFFDGTNTNLDLSSGFAMCTRLMNSVPDGEDPCSIDC